MPKFIDLSGAKFGKLLVVSRAEDYITSSGKHKTQFTCVCECGKSIIVRSYDLVSGHTASCGCSRTKSKCHGIKVCIYNPTAVNCTELKCSKCGWNPDNEGLRRKRLLKLKRKVGIDG